MINAPASQAIGAMTGLAVVCVAEVCKVLPGPLFCIARKVRQVAGPRLAMPCISLRVAVMVSTFLLIRLSAVKPARLASAKEIAQGRPLRKEDLATSRPHSCTPPNCLDLHPRCTVTAVAAAVAADAGTAVLCTQVLYLTLFNAAFRPIDCCALRCVAVICTTFVTECQVTQASKSSACCRGYESMNRLVGEAQQVGRGESC